MASDNSDATYAGSGQSDYVYVDFGTVSLPAGAIVKAIVPRVRWEAVDSATNVNHAAGHPLIGIQLKVPSQGLIGSLFGTTSVAGWSTDSAPTYAPTFLMSQADVDGLQIYYFQDDPPYDGLWFNWFSELYIDVTYALVPTTTATGPTGTLATSAGTAAWTYTQGSDGTAQQKYRVKVYTSAEYGAGGFDPETTAVTVYDSGDVLSAATTAPISGLPNSTTLRAYIKTAQVVNGITQWSAWAFSGFSTSFTVSTVSSVVATPSNALAKHTVVVNRNTGTDAWNFVDLQRSIDAGASWVFVRDGNHAVASGNTFTLDDFESPNGTSTLYRARAYSSVTGAVGAWVQSTPANAWTSASTWLKDPNNSALNKVVRAHVLPSPSRGRQQNVFYPIGRSDPIVVSDILRLRSGAIDFTTITAQESTDLLALFGSQVLLLQAPSSHAIGSMYLVFVSDVVENRAVRPAVYAHRYWSANFVEVLSPADT